MDKVALEFSRRYIVKKYIKIWQDFVIEERLLYWDKENRADEHNEKYVCKFHFFHRKSVCMKTRGLSLS